MNLSTLTPASTTSANGSSFANNNTSSPTITLSSSIKSRIREDEYNKRNYNEDNSYSSYPSSSFIPTTNNNYQQSSSSTCTTIPFSSEDGNPHIKSSTTINNSLSYNNHYYNKIIFEDEDYLYRTIHRDDLPQLQKLQQELFPVKYNKQFYLKLLDKEKTYTLLAFFKRTNELVGVCSCSLLQEDYNESTALTSSSSSSNNNNNSNSGLGYYLNNFLNLITLSSPEKINICYIMTLGVKCTHRRKGLASKMLQILEEVVSIEPYDCLKLTLHCKIDNQQALAFYKQNAFVIKDTIEDYYDFGSHLEGAYKLEKDLSHMRNDHWKEQELMGKRSSSPTSSSSNGSMISSPSSRSTPLLSHSDKYHQTMSTMSCLTFSVQICKIIVESFKFVVLDTYYTISKVILPSSSNQEVYHMNATSNYPTTTTNHPNRPRIVLQVQEQENLQ